MPDHRLKEWICGLLDGVIREPELQRLIQHCINMAKEMLRLRHWRQMNLLLRDEYKLETLASRCIEDLFLPVHGETCREIRRYFRALDPSLDLLPEADVEVHLRRIVSVTVQQTVMELMGEVDPVYRKILRNVQDVLRESDAFETEERFNEKWIFHSATPPARRAGQEIPFEDLLTALMASIRSDTTAVAGINAALSAARMAEQFSPGVRLHTLVKVLRALFQAHYDIHVATEGGAADRREDAEAMEEMEELERRLRGSALHVHRSALIPYVRKGVMSEEAAERMRDVILAYLRDLLDGEARPLHEYHRDAFPHISYEAYRTTERARFEYVAKLARNHFFKSGLDFLGQE
jgi:hypothetical protein